MDSAKVTSSTYSKELPTGNPLARRVILMGMSFNTFDSCGYGGVGDFFPEDLSSVYPWPNFYNGTMERYLKGDEYVGGCWGYETRYPYCDKDLVQEFLWLKPNLKNSYKGSCYKPALLYYLVKGKGQF